MMRALAALALMGVAADAAAQIAPRSDPQVIDRRVGKLESEMRAVQRKVFPGGDPKFFEPEIGPVQPAPIETVGTPATAPLADLTARVDGLERQLRELTGQIEADQFKLRQLEEGFAKFRGDAEFRLNALEGTGPAAAAAAPATADATLKPPPEAPAPKPKPVDAEGAWKVAYSSVTAKDWPVAETALTDYLAKYPKATRASQAQYWLGRSHAARRQPAQAAKAYLDGYQKYPKGERAPDSLLGLAGALTELKKPDQACRVLGELDAAYAEKLTPGQKAEASKARTAAKCA